MITDEENAIAWLQADILRLSSNYENDKNDMETRLMRIAAYALAIDALGGL